MLKSSCIYLLYYRAPYEDEPELVCTCEDLPAVYDAIYLYMHKAPDAYPDYHRFESRPIEFWKKEN